MRSVTLIACFGLLLSLSSGLSVAQAQTPPGTPIYWRQNVFSIPFRVNRDQTAVDAPAEVQLLMRQGPDQPWTTTAKARPDLGGFVFRAPRDGQYTFTIRTIDRQNRIHVANAADTLSVVVDTTPPVLQLQGTAGTAGQLQVQWNATDTHLNPQSLKIEYQTDPQQPWHPLALQGHQVGPSPTQSTGSLSYLPPNHQGRVTVRGEVTDKAGNRTISQAAVLLRDEVPNQGTLYQNVSQRREPLPNGASPQDNFDPSGLGGSQSWRPSKIAQRPLEQQTVANLSGQPRSIRRPTNPFQSPGPGNRNTPNSDRPLSNPMPTGPVEPPLGVLPRVVGSKTFQLQYDVLSTGSAQLSKVELWATRDGGRSWQSFGTDPDRQSPFLVQVDQPGLYGFHIVLQNTAGLGSDPPRNGDAPEIWIDVRPRSTPPPRGRLLDATPVHNPAPAAERPGY